MGATLNTANAMGAYTLADRGTWIAFRNRSELTIVLEGDPPLFNPYGVILVNPAKHPHVKAAQGQAFIDWLVGPEGQQAIGAFEVDGEVLFKPSAAPRPPSD
jgi:tungstate transport system substrate-binding protein